MNRADKIATGFIAFVGVTLFTAAGMTIAEQGRTILRQKKRIQLLEETIGLMYRLNTGENVKDEIIDHVMKNTMIPDDISNL